MNHSDDTDDNRTKNNTSPLARGVDGETMSIDLNR